MPGLGNAITLAFTPGSGVIPASGKALFWLDGQIDSNEFVDRTGNGRNFTITNKDWTTGEYFPYKSEATIAAPSGDAVLFAADINSFLYGVDADNPNEIPVVSFFQNIDYEDVIFVKHQTQILDGNNVETTEPHLDHIAMYSGLDASEIVQCYSFYVVPTKDVSAFWIDPVGGDDGTGDGSEGNPYKTVKFVETQGAAIGKTVYVKTGDETLSALWVEDFAINWQAIGFYNITEGANSRVLRVNSASTFNGFNFVVGDTAHDNVLSYGSAVFTRCRFVSGKSGYNMSIYSDTTMNSCIGDLLIRILGGSSITVTKDGCRGLELAFQSVATTPTYNNSHSICNQQEGVYISFTAIAIHDCTYYGDSIISEYVASLGTVSLTYNSFYANIDNAGLINKRTGVFQTLTYTARYNRVYNNGYNGVNICTFIELQDILIIEYNTFVPDDLATDSFGVRLTQNGTAAIIKINYNHIVQKAQTTGNIINLGNSEVNGSIGDLDGSEVIGNVIFGPSYYGNQGAHTMLISNQLNIIIKYNRLYNNLLGIVIKNHHTDPQTYTGAVSYNLLTNCPLLARGMKGVSFIGNTVINSYIHLLTTEGTLTEADDCTIINNVFNNIDYVGACMLIDDDSINGLTENNNIVYNYDDYQNVTANGTLSEWQALGHGTDSLDSDPDLDADYVPNEGSPAIGGGDTLAAALDDGLDETTDWGDVNTLPVIVTKQQTAPWDMGVFVS